MKKIALFSTVLVVCIAGCRNPSSQPAANKGGPGAPGSIIPRNTSINKSNAYSDLFLDSTAIERFINHQKLNDTIAGNMRSFYNARNFQLAWFASDGLTEQALAFRTLYDYSQDSSNTRKSLDNKLDELMSEDSLPASAIDADIIKTELLLTWRFIRYLGDQYANPKQRLKALEKLVPAQKQEVLQKADRVLADDYNANNGRYSSLKDQLKKYMVIARNNGWPTIPVIKKKYSKGNHAPLIALVKKRIRITEALPGNDSSSFFDSGLDTAVKMLQAGYGQKPNGIISPALIKALNIPVTVRIAQILVNMERMRWMPAEPEGKLILVNIPEFKLHAWEGKNKVFDMDIIVGKEGHNTVMFSGRLNQVVFSPYWNLPPGIIRREILPALEKNKHYLEENNMEITGERNGLPVIRQLPGEKNALGKVKFLFPNSHHIYFHDTPEKWLFNKNKRAYSHGCIRLSDPVTMANYLLGAQPEWSPQRIDSAMNSGKEKYVKIKTPVPVLIYYYTAWVDEDGQLQFREDIYGHDHRLANKLFLDPQYNSIGSR
jgi:murein L,D-transpeptidase YcbB/YkuD